MFKIFDRLNTSKTCDEQQVIIEYFKKHSFPPKAIVDKFIKDLEYHELLFTDKFKKIFQFKYNNIFIRQYALLSVLYKIKGNNELADKYSKSVLEVMKSLMYKGYYMEGFDYYLYAKKATDLMANYVIGKSAVIEEWNQIEKNYLRFVFKNKKVYFNESNENPRNDSYRLKEDFYSDDVYTYVRRGDTEILITHNENIINHSSNLHVNWDFGHIVVVKKGIEILKHCFYRGYPDKMKRKTYKSKFRNVVVGWFNSEFWWRIFKKKILKVEKYATGKFIKCFIGEAAQRNFLIGHDFFQIQDFDGKHTILNVSENWEENIEIPATVNYEILKDGRIRLTGDFRYWNIKL